LDDGVNRDNILFENGRVFYFDGSKDPQQLNNAYLNYDGQSANFTVGDTLHGGTSNATATIIRDIDSGTTGTLYLQTVSGTFQNNETITDDHTGSALVNGTLTTTTFANTSGDFYSCCRYGSYMIFADRAEHELYKWKHGDQRLTPLITTAGATLYKFRYVFEWQRRIFGVYSDQTNGDIELRYTDALPTWSDVDFPAANQLYKPTTDSFSGVSKMGSNSMYLYGTESISRLEYIGDVTVPFQIISMVDDQGNDAPYSIINAYGCNWFFNKNYGFVRYLGGSTLVPQDSISQPIDDMIQTIDSRYYSQITGVYLPLQKELCWAVPLNAATTPNALLYYDPEQKMWRYQDFSTHCVNVFTRAAGEYKKPVFGTSDGYVYQIAGDTLPSTSNLSSYRVEPILDFGDPYVMKTVTEIWFDIVAGGDYSIDVSYRVGDTTKELLGASWTALGSLSLNDPAEPYLPVSVTGRKIQFKWGTDVDSEYFSINAIHLVYDKETRW